MREFPTVREARLYKRLRRNKVRCALCERRCTIADGALGYCKTRKNINGTLFTLVYGDLCAIESRPIEIKPFFHYWPGSSSLTYATWSCNFACAWCQNFMLSRALPDPTRAKSILPEKIIEMALSAGDDGVCASFTEPTLLHEFNLDVFALARRRGLYCCYVSNGYMTREALHELRAAGLDGLKIDVKGDQEVYNRYCGGAKVDIIWKNAEAAKKLGLHVEIVNLVVTDVNDDDECLNWVIAQHLKHCGQDVPLHFTRYYPAYKFTNPETAVETLEKAYEMAKATGIKFPYLGNVPGHKYESTYCPKCNKLLIQRFGTTILQFNIKNSKCACGEHIPITGQRVEKLFPRGRTFI